MNNSNLMATLASATFLLHIAGNLFFTRPTPAAMERLSNLRELSLFPPDWVFGIWIIIWGLQSVMLVQTFGSSFWTTTTAALFILTCAGNLGSQIAGAQNAPWFIYLACLGVMLCAAFAFMLRATAGSGMTAPGIWASQLYTGWASLALIVGSGAILVCYKSVVSDNAFTIAGLALVALVPGVIWTLWALGKADWRIMSAPYGLLVVALLVRKIAAHAEIK